MGFKINVNNILRSDEYDQVVVNERYKFHKSELSLLADDISIWLTKKDWTPLAEIKVATQVRDETGTHGEFEVLYVYTEIEQKLLRSIFRRMYGWA